MPNPSQEAKYFHDYVRFFLYFLFLLFRRTVIDTISNSATQSSIRFTYNFNPPWSFYNFILSIPFQNMAQSNFPMMNGMPPQVFYLKFKYVFLTFWIYFSNHSPHPPILFALSGYISRGLILIPRIVY